MPCTAAAGLSGEVVTLLACRRGEGFQVNPMLHGLLLCVSPTLKVLQEVSLHASVSMIHVRGYQA